MKAEQRLLTKLVKTMGYLLLLILAMTLYFGEKFKDYNPFSLPRYILEDIW